MQTRWKVSVATWVWLLFFFLILSADVFFVVAGQRPVRPREQRRVRLLLRHRHQRLPHPPLRDGADAGGAGQGIHGAIGRPNQYLRATRILITD